LRLHPNTPFRLIGDVFRDALLFSVYLLLVVIFIILDKDTKCREPFAGRSVV
jgi:hypothetical protein